MATSEIGRQKIDQLIADEFGVNADYVSELLAQFERDRSSVDDEWRSFFDELLGTGEAAAEVRSSGPAAQTPAIKGAGPGPINTAPGAIHATYQWGNEAKPSEQAAPPAPAPPIHASAAPVATEGEPVERIPIRGPALRIAENMEASLSVPTATSQRPTRQMRHFLCGQAVRTQRRRHQLISLHFPTCGLSSFLSS